MSTTKTVPELKFEIQKLNEWVKELIDTPFDVSDY
jgi:hypothetical protein